MAITYGIKQVATIDNVNVLETKYIDLADSGATKTSTSGTITNEQLTILQASKQNCIIFDNQIYRLQDNEHNSGILTYTYNGYDTEIVSKTITITISTLGWTLTELSASAGGTNVEANNGETTSATLNTLKVGETNYAVPQGGGSSVQTLTGTAVFTPPITFSGIIENEYFMYAQLNDKISNITNVEIRIDIPFTEEIVYNIIIKYDYSSDNLVGSMEVEGQGSVNMVAIPFVHNNIQYLILDGNGVYLSNTGGRFTTNDAEIQILKYVAQHLSFYSRRYLDTYTSVVEHYICSLGSDVQNQKLEIYGVGHEGNNLYTIDIDCYSDENEIHFVKGGYTLTHDS